MASNTTSTAVHVLSLNTTAGFIFDRLSVPDILDLSLVCSAIYKAIRDWFPVGYNVNNHLRRFFDEPLSFRILQAQTGTLVSGSSALQFFERRYFPDSDLDLYVPCRHTSAVADFLIQNDYQFVPNERQQLSIPHDAIMNHFISVSRRTTANPVLEHPDGYPWGEFEDIFNFIHRLDGGRKVQIICVSPGATPLNSILCFHSTLVMNFIAWDMACSLFPAATFLHHTGLLINKPKPTTIKRPGMAKYWARGYKFPPEPAFPILPWEQKLYPKEALPAFSSIPPLEIAYQRAPSGFTLREVQDYMSGNIIPRISHRLITSSLALQYSYILPKEADFEGVSKFVSSRHQFALQQWMMLQDLQWNRETAAESMELDAVQPRGWDEEVIFLIQDILRRRGTV